MVGKAIRRIPRGALSSLPSREPERRAGGIWGLGFSLLSDLGEQRTQGGEEAFLHQCLQHLLPA